jgi:hypothetical protein
MRGVCKQQHKQIVFVLGVFYYDYDMVVLACNVMALKTLRTNGTPYTRT